MAGILQRLELAVAGGASRVLPDSLLEIERELAGRLGRTELHLNSFGFDAYGFNPEWARRLFLPLALMHRYYFRVENHGIEKVPTGRVILIANHAGQFAYDGSMLGMSMLLDAQPPRLCRGMGEYFLWRVPWVGTFAARIGTLVGTPENCIEMLAEGECVMVFPEGARGANKPFHKRYQLQKFGKGFMRLALETQAPIVPVGIVGSEEQQPGFANLEGLGRTLGLPSLPITISQPWFGPLGSVFALPVKYHIHFGEPLEFEGDPNDEDAIIREKVDAVQAAVADLLSRGREERRSIFF
jgi:1-acyl-sn-glycerol-3-phosphate acyltransferase